MMDTNCPISKQNYQFLPGALSGPLSIDTNSMEFRMPSFKHTSLNLSRDRSAQNSLIYEAAAPFVTFPTLNSYMCRLVVANKTAFVFFHIQHSQMGSIYAFPQSESLDPEILLYTQGALESRLFNAGRPRGTLFLSSAERKNTFFLSCLLHGSHSKMAISIFFGGCFENGKAYTFLGNSLKKSNSGSKCNVKILNKKT